MLLIVKGNKKLLYPNKMLKRIHKHFISRTEKIP